MAAGLICLKKHHFNAMCMGKSRRISQAYGMFSINMLRSAQLKRDVITSADSNNEIESDDE
nr:hypothetical protein [Tanacetum cinerariifolium]